MSIITGTRDLRLFSWWHSLPRMPEQKPTSITRPTLQLISLYHPLAGPSVLDYKLPNGIMVRGNVAYDKLLEDIEEPGVETRFNTPDYRANLSIGHNEIIRKMGFNVNFHWQNSFIWESGFGAGEIPSTMTLDAHVSYKVTADKNAF